MKHVLILYNQFEAGSGAFAESCAGVLDQVRAVADSLDALGLESEALAVADLRDLAGLLSRRPEKLVFNLIEEFAGSIRDACAVPALCEAFGVGCTGNGTEALTLAQDKHRAKMILASAGLPCPAGAAVRPGGCVPGDLPEGLYIVKPACCDASEGIGADSVVPVPSARAEALVRRVHEQFGQTAIIEAFIPSRELNVSVIEIAGRPRVLPPAEIDFSAFSEGQLRLVDYEAKWVSDSFGYHHTPRILPARLDESLAETIVTLAERAWNVLGCGGYARVDFRLDEQDRPFILEVNPNPDISPDAGFAAALAAADIPYERFVWMMLPLADLRRRRSALPLAGRPA